MPTDFFYFGICHFCKTDSKKLQRCSSCKTVAYCSKQHQKSDWRNHKEICKAISSTLRNVVKIENCTFQEWKNYRVCCQTAWIAALNRPLEPFECQMWMFPRVCSICYSRKNLTDCSKCRNVAYCSDAHLEQHKVIHVNFCENLKLCLDIDRYLAGKKSYPQIKLKQTMPSAKEFPEDIGKLMELVEKKLISEGEELVCERVLKTDSIAPGAIILYALEICGVTQFHQDKFVIHVVGASASEGTTDWQIATELIFHWTQYLREITFIFIGPEAWDISSDNFELCQACKGDRKVLKVKVHKQLYHQVVGSIEKPNLVISFNSGLHEYEGQNCDLWNKSIPMLVKHIDVPFVFTSYTEEEMTKDLQRIKDISKLKLSVLKCGKNPFASPRPIRDWCTKDIPVFYSSGYIVVVRRPGRSYCMLNQKLEAQVTSKMC